MGVGGWGGCGTEEWRDDDAGDKGYQGDHDEGERDFGVVDARSEGTETQVSW